MHPFFSIIIPVYNVAPYLRECLDSVLAQTFSNWEAVCVDDGSADGSGKILDEYAARDNRFKVVHQQNAGVSAARNVALGCSSGTYIVFLDADDEINRNILSNVNQITATKPDVDAVCYRIQTVGVQGERGLFGAPFHSGLFSGDEILRQIGGGISPALIWVVTDKAFKREIISKLALRFEPRLQNGEDSLFTQQFLAYSKNVVVDSDLIGYIYKVRDGSAARTLRLHLPEDPLLELYEVYGLWKRLRSPGLRALTRYRAANFVYLGLGRRFAPSARKEGINYLLSSAFFNHHIIPFLLFYGTFKSRIFALVYLLSPRYIRKLILRII